MNDLEVLARTLYGEAEANEEEDAVAIAHVIMNRVGYKNWPSTINEVCTQPWQFSCWNSNDPNRVRLLNVKENDKWFAQCKRIARDVMDGLIPDPTFKSTHYHTTYIKAPKWSKGKTPVYKTDGGRYTHLFYNDIDTKAPETAKEALDQIRPLSQSGTVKGAVVAGGSSLAVAGTQVAEIVSTATQVGSGLHTILSYGLVVVAILAVAGVGYMLYRRYKDRQVGLR